MVTAGHVVASSAVVALDTEEEMTMLVVEAGLVEDQACFADLPETTLEPLPGLVTAEEECGHLDQAKANGNQGLIRMDEDLVVGDEEVLLVLLEVWDLEMLAECLLELLVL